MDYRARRRAVVAELKKHEWLLTADIAVALGVSQSTIRRDVAALRAQGISVEGRPGRGLRLSDAHLVASTAFLSDEAALMVVGCTVVAASLDKDTQAVAQHVRKRLMEAGTDQLIADVEALELKLRLVPGGLVRAARVQAALELIRQALISQRVLHFTLEGSTVQHAFCPYSLARIYGHWCVVGYSVAEGGVCNYRVDALAGLSLREEKFVTPAAYASTTGPQMEEGSAPIRVEFDAISSYQVIAAPASFIRDAQKREDGIVVTLEDVPEVSLLPWILGWASHARVLSPSALAKRVAEAAAATVRQYERATTERDRQMSMF